MGIQLERKKETVAALHERLAGAQFVVAAEYAGLDVAMMQTLHRAAGAAGVHVRIYKNTLARRSAAGTPYEFVAERLTGQLVLGMTAGDPTALAKVFHRFGKEHEPLKLTFGALPYQRLVEPAEIGRLADIPPREVLLAQLAGMLRTPAANFARALGAVHSKLARVLAAVRDAKGE
jgi:large subunit ribosomal protein L10